MFKNLFTMFFIAVVMIAAANVVQAQQDNGPSNYCIPSAAMVPEIGSNTALWCYPSYISSVIPQYESYFKIPIRDVKVINATTNELMMHRTSQWEGCYSYKGDKAEMQPGETYNISFKAYYDYLIYSGSDYCVLYGYTMTYATRVFIDFNIDGDWDDPNEWVNSPERIASGLTKKIGNTYDWRFNLQCGQEHTQTYQIKVPDDQKNGVTRMRIMTSYYYPYTLGSDFGQAANACWNGYAYLYYWNGPDRWYGYNYGEMEDYLIDFALPFKATFPDSKPPHDILLAAQDYNGTTRMHEGEMMEFPRPMVQFGSPQSPGTTLFYRIVGPLPEQTVIYEGLDPVTGSPDIRVGTDVIGQNVNYYIQAARGVAAKNGTYTFRHSSGGEYQLVLGIKKPGAGQEYKIGRKNFTVSWEWDMAAQNVVNPLSSGPPRFHIYPRGLEIQLQGEVQNVGLRPVAKFDAYFRIYNSKNELITERKREWDTTNFGDFLVLAKQKVLIDFGVFKSTIPDEYTVKLEVVLRSASDMEPYNDNFRRLDAEEAYIFSIRDEIQAQAYAINVPASGSEIIAGRPFIPMVDLRNMGVGDITDAPTRLVITEEPSGIRVLEQNIIVQDIPSGRYNIKSVRFNPMIITKPGTYKATLTVSHPDDLVLEDNEISIIFYVTGGLQGTYTIGTKNQNSINNFKTIDEAMDAIYLRGLSGSITFELTDDVYEVYSRNNFAPAWDLSTAIMGLGYNEQTGEYRTLTFKPSAAKAVTRGSVIVKLFTTNGQGVFFGQAESCTNPYAIQQVSFGREYYIGFSNSGGYITFDGGTNQSLKFVLNTETEAFGSVFYLNAGSHNISIKNIIMENNTARIKNSVHLPNVHFSIVDGFLFTPDEAMTETGARGYSAGIVNRGKVQGLRTEEYILAFDTIPNVNNSFINNDISGFGYGIVSYGIGPLRVPAISDFLPFYNMNTKIENNKLYNLAGAGVVVGHEESSTVKNNTIYNVNGPGSITAGIIAGGNASADLLGYNNKHLTIDGNSISDVKGNERVYGILIEQNANKYQLGAEFRLFPQETDDLVAVNNAMWNINAGRQESMRAGVHALTERNHAVTDMNMRMLTPRHADYLIRDLMIANNTVILGEDGVTNLGNIAGMGIQQATGATVKNNAVAIVDNSISGTNLVSSAVFYQGSYPYEDSGMHSDRNAYWLGSSNASIYRHVYTNSRNRIIEYGDRNEYLDLEQWQMASGNELNSISNGNFVNDHYYEGSNPQKLRIKPNVKGSVLSKRGDVLSEYGRDVYGNIRGIAGSRFDLGAIEFNGSLYNRDTETLVITSPGNYRATNGMFSDAEYVMTEAPIEVKAIVRNSGSLQVNDKKIYASIYRESPSGTYILEHGNVEAVVDIESTENLEVRFNLADGIGTDWVPMTYNDLRGTGYVIPSQFVGMEPNVTPRYRIDITMDADEQNGNNTVSKTVRFYLRRSPIKALISSQHYVNVNEMELGTDALASGLNKKALDKGMELLDWKIVLADGRYDYDVFQRAGWEPRSVDYNKYRTLLWSDGHDKSLTRLEKLNLTNFVMNGTVSEKSNLIIGSQEMVRENTNVDDADEVFLRNILRAEYRFPGNPLGANQNYSGNTMTGVSIGRNLTFDVLSTGVEGDMYPQPALMNIAETGDGISKMAFRYNKVQNDEWPDIARIAGVTSSNLFSNIVYLGIDWRHFGDIETVLRGSFDYVEGNGGIVVPVDLLSFNARQVGGRVDVNWSTASEQNTARFEVERADVLPTGTSSYVKIDEMAAAGNSSVIKHYGPVVDNKVSYGNTYSYRLKTLDRDGSHSYSDEQIVTMTGLSGAAWLGTASPNPANGESKVSYRLSESGSLRISMYDASGKEIAVLFDGTQTSGEHVLNINAGNYMSGLYTLVLQSGNIHLTTPITIVK